MKTYLLYRLDHGVVIDVHNDGEDDSLIFSKNIHPMIAKSIQNRIKSLPLFTEEYVHDFIDQMGYDFYTLEVPTGSLIELWKNEPVFFRDMNLAPYIRVENNLFI